MVMVKSVILAVYVVQLPWWENDEVERMETWHVSREGAGEPALRIV